MANFQQQFEAMGYKYDKLTSVGYNNVNGFYFTVCVAPDGKQYTVSVSFALPDANAAGYFNQALGQFLAERKKTIISGVYANNRLDLCYKFKGLAPDVTEGVKEATDACMYFFNQFRAVPACSCCGRPNGTSLYAMEKNISALCSECFVSERSRISTKNRDIDETKENVPLGIVGSVLGALVGAVIWVLMSVLGRIVWAAGLASGVLSFFGYKRFAKKMTRKGLIISLVLGFVILLAGMYCAFAIDVYNAENDYLTEYNTYFSDYLDGPREYISYFDALALVPEYFVYDVGTAIYNNIFGIIGYVVAAVGCIATTMFDKKTKNRIERLM